MAGSMLLGAGLVWANLWRALIVLSPAATRFEIDDGTADATVPGWLEPTDAALKTLGFNPLGTWLELRRFGPTRTSWGYVNGATSTWAVVSDSWLVRAHRSVATPPEPRLEREGPAARVSFITLSDDGRSLVSSNFRRPGAETPDHQCAGLPGVTIERLFKAHQRRAEALSGVGAVSSGLDGLVTFLALASRTVQRRELRAQHAVGLLWTLGGLGMVSAPLFGRLWGTT